MRRLILFISIMVLALTSCVKENFETETIDVQLKTAVNYEVNQIQDFVPYGDLVHVCECAKCVASRIKPSEPSDPLYEPQIIGLNPDRVIPNNPLSGYYVDELFGNYTQEEIVKLCKCGGCTHLNEGGGSADKINNPIYLSVVN